MSILREIKNTRDDYKSFIDHLKEKDYVDNEISLATGWVDALNYLLYIMTSENRTPMEQASDAEDPDYPGVTEETLKQQEMIHCKDGHCDI